MEATDVHVRINGELAGLVERATAEMRRRGKVHVSRSAAVRALIEFGATELLRDRGGRKNGG